MRQLATGLFTRHEKGRKNPLYTDARAAFADTLRMQTWCGAAKTHHREFCMRSLLERGTASGSMTVPVRATCRLIPDCRIASAGLAGAGADQCRYGQVTAGFGKHGLSNPGFPRNRLQRAAHGRMVRGQVGH